MGVCVCVCVFFRLVCRHDISGHYGLYSGCFFPLRLQKKASKSLSGLVGARAGRFVASPVAQNSKERGPLDIPSQTPKADPDSRCPLGLYTELQDPYIDIDIDTDIDTDIDIDIDIIRYPKMDSP